MDANFCYYSIYDRFIQNNHVRAFVNFFCGKTSQKQLTGLLPNFTGMFLRQRLKTSLHRYKKKSGLWSDTGAQAPLVPTVFLGVSLCKTLQSPA